MDFTFSKSNLPRGLFINNTLVSSTGSDKVAVYNPKDGTLVADDVSVANEQDVEKAVTAAEKGFEAWRAFLPEQRQQIMYKFADLIEKHTVELAELSRITMGAPYESFGKFEVGTAVAMFRYFAGWVDKFMGESLPQDDGFLKIIRNEPLGVCAGVVPWNGPTGNFSLKAAPALATGNSFILKPSEKSPFSTLALAPLIIEAGFPPGVIQILTGDGRTGALLASHPRIKKISFTGSVATGKKIQELAIRSNMKRVTLELGGKSPAVVFNDCLLENAVQWCANMITANTGQLCFAPTRVYVQDGIFDAFSKRYKEVLEDKQRQVGDPDSDQTTIGPLADKAQFDRVNGFIERAKKADAKVLVGGSSIGDKGYYVEPTVFTDFTLESEIHREEVFGPVAVLRKFTSEDEVIHLANDSNFGLMAGVFSQDINRALRVASKFDSGMVGVNCVSKLFPSCPFGGSKESGLGREGGIYALRAYTEVKTIFINLTY